MELLSTEALVAFLTLTALEIVLGIDNIVFLVLVVDKLPQAQRNSARKLGLSLAMILRIALLLSISWVMNVTTPFFTLFEHPISLRNLVLIGGGLFLIAKSTLEIHEKVEAHSSKPKKTKNLSFQSAIIQILALDLIFSLDSVITAVGMVNRVEIMVASIVLAVLIMILFSEKISQFVSAHPTIKILALSFLILIGLMLVIEGLGQHINRGYIYFAMGFSLAVELLNMKTRASES